MSESVTTSDKACLLIIDMQEGYPTPVSDGLVRKIKACCSKFSCIVNLMYENNETTAPYKKLGWKYLTVGNNAVMSEFKEYKTFVKHKYDGCQKDLLDFLEQQGVTNIYVCGVLTDACVLATSISLFETDFDVNVIGDCCEGSTEALHHASLQVLYHLLNGQIVSISDVMKRNDEITS